MAEPEIHPALGHLRAVSRDYPGCWKQFDHFRQSREALGGWPEHVYCPMAVAYAIIAGGAGRTVPLLASPDISRLAALAAWRPTQGIYRFDRDLFEALARTPVSGELPCELLHRLPAWAVYVEAPTDLHDVLGWRGFFAHLEYDPNHGSEELRLLIDTSDGLLPVPLHLGPWDLGTALARAGERASAHREALGLGAIQPGHLSRLAGLYAPMVSLLLYLCAEEADYARPPWPRPKRTKERLWRLFPAKHPSEIPVGVRLGAALRAHREAEQGGALTGGAAHWHAFWKGPRDGERERFVKWLAPIGVGFDLQGGAAPGAVVRPVKDRPETPKESC